MQHHHVFTLDLILFFAHGQTQTCVVYRQETDRRICDAWANVTSSSSLFVQKLVGLHVNVDK